MAWVKTSWPVRHWDLHRRSWTRCEKPGVYSWGLGLKVGRAKGLGYLSLSFLSRLGCRAASCLGGHMGSQGRSESRSRRGLVCVSWGASALQCWGLGLKVLVCVCERGGKKVRMGVLLGGLQAMEHRTWAERGCSRSRTSPVGRGCWQRSRIWMARALSASSPDRCDPRNTAVGLVAWRMQHTLTAVSISWP